MARRLELQALLEEIVEHVYFQPPPSLKLTFPCIVYQRDATATQHADDVPYFRQQRYQVTVIDRNPDSTLPSVVGSLPTSSHVRFFTADSLNHDVFTLYF